jgi:hypothetical protein
VVGGGLVGQDISEPKIELSAGTNGTNANGNDDSLGIVALGPFIDWFPDEKSGGHVGLLLGFGGIGLQDENGDSASGVGASIFGGYDFWVGKQWSLGPEARIVYVHTTREVLDAKFKDDALSFELLFSALFH